MARTTKLNTQKAEVIERNHLLQDPEGLPPTSSTVVLSTHIPEMRRVIFLNGRDPGCALNFHYHSKTHPLLHYTLYHGMEHELPVEIIEHLENCGEKIYGYKTGPEGHPEAYVKNTKYIFSFKSPQRKHEMA
jgi:hypothetical protein